MVALVEELYQLAKSSPQYHHYSREQIVDRITHACQKQRYLIVREQGCVVGYMEYREARPGIMHVRDLIATSAHVLWQLKSLAYTLPWKRVFFRRLKTQQWKHHRRIAHGAL